MGGAIMRFRNNSETAEYTKFVYSMLYAIVSKRLKTDNRVGYHEKNMG